MNKKGFTLIELLAVIVILAIIALIAVPLILNVIEKAKKGAFQDSAYGIAKAAEYTYLDMVTDKQPEELWFNYNNYEISSGNPDYSLNYNGKSPLSGNVIIKTTGEIGLALFDGTYCAVKGYSDSRVIIEEDLDESECGINEIPPLITIQGYEGQNEITITLDIGEEFNVPDATAEDDVDGVVPVTINPTEIDTNIPGTYIITYTASDSVNNTATKTITVIIEDSIPPVITLLGDNPLTINIGGTYVEPGATAIDNVDGDLTSSIVITGNVNPNIPGDYTVIYTVTDSSNNETSVEREVIVKPSTLMIASSGNATTPYLGGPITKGSIESLVFTTNKDVPADAIGFWDVSSDQDGSIIAWYTDIDNNGLYELTIGSNGKVYGNEDSSYLFFVLSNLKTIDLNNFNTSNVTSMERMFATTSLTSLDLSSFDTTNVTDMSRMFSGASSLVSIDLSSFDTSSVTTMVGMFSGTSSLQSIDVSHFDTSNVTNMYNMFRGMGSLTSLNLSNFDTSSVTNMRSMFYESGSLLSLDLSSFDTSNVTDMRYMFFYTNLTNIDFRNATFNKVTHTIQMFLGSKQGVTIQTKNGTTRSWLLSRLNEAGISGNVVISP